MYEILFLFQSCAEQIKNATADEVRWKCKSKLISMYFFFKKERKNNLTFVILVLHVYSCVLNDSHYYNEKINIHYKHFGPII